MQLRRSNVQAPASLLNILAAKDALYWPSWLSGWSFHIDSAHI